MQKIELVVLEPVTTFAVPAVPLKLRYLCMGTSLLDFNYLKFERQKELTRCSHLEAGRLDATLSVLRT